MRAQTLTAIVALCAFVAVATAPTLGLSEGMPAEPQAGMPSMEQPPMQPQAAMPSGAGGGNQPMVSCQCPKAMDALSPTARAGLMALGGLLLVSAIAALISLSVFLIRRSRIAVPT